MNADHRGIGRGVDHDELGMRTGEPAAAISFARLVADRIEHMPRLITQIDDELHRAIRKNTLQAMIGIEAFVKPKQLDELIERRSRDVRSEYHEWKHRMTRSTERHENYWQSGVQLSRLETRLYPRFGSHGSHLRVLTRAHTAWSIHTCRR